MKPIENSEEAESTKLLEDDNPTFVQARHAVLAAIDALHQGGAITTAERDTALPRTRRGCG